MTSDEVTNPSSFMGEADIADPTYRYILDRLPVSSGRVLDLGSGRGRFLTMAHAAGFGVMGVDSDDWSVRHTQSLGLRAECADIWSFLEGRDNVESFDVITAIHFVEHFSPEDVQRLICLGSNLLRPGGSLVLVTPNFADWRVASEVFWLDPTHVRPYPLPLLAQMGSRAGLDTIHSSTGVLVKMGARRLFARPLQRLRFGAEYDRMNAVIILRKPTPPFPIRT